MFDFLEVLPKLTEDFFSLAICYLLSEFTQGEVHHVVVMQLFRGDFTTEFQPDAMQEIDFLGSKARRMGTQIEDMFLAVRRVDFEGQLGLGVRQVFPSQARRAGFLRHRSPGGKAEHDGRGLQALGGTQDAVPFLRRRSNGQMNGLAFLFGQIQGAGKKFLLLEAEKLFGRQTVLT